MDPLRQIVENRTAVESHQRKILRQTITLFARLLIDPQCIVIAGTENCRRRRAFLHDASNALPVILIINQLPAKFRVRAIHHSVRNASQIRQFFRRNRHRLILSEHSRV